MGMKCILYLTFQFLLILGLCLLKCNAEAEAEAEADPKINYGWMRQYHNRFVNNILRKTNRYLPNVKSTENVVFKHPERPLLDHPQFRNPLDLYNNLSIQKGKRNIGKIGKGIINAYKKTP